MAKLTVGLEITPGFVRAAVIRHHKQQMILEKLAELPLSPEAMTVSGVVDSETVTRTVRDLWTTYKIKHKKVATAVSGQRVVVRKADVPWMPKNEIRDTLAAYVGDLLPFDAAEAVMDFVVNNESNNDEDGTLQISGLLAAAAEDVVVNLVDAIQDAKLTVTDVDLIAFAVLRSVVEPIPLGMMISEAVININQSSTQVIVHTNGRPELVRGLGIGKDAVEEELGQLGAGALPSEAAMALEPLTSEIQSTVGFYQAQEDSHRLSRLILVGDGSQLRGIDQALANNLQLPVVHDAAWLSMQRGPEVTDDVLLALAANMAAPVGLAMVAS